MVKKLSRYEVKCAGSNALSLFEYFFLFYDVVYPNGAKHSSWFRPRYGNDGWTGLWPEFVRLVTFFKIWKIKRGSFPETILLQVSISLCDILKRKLSKSGHKTSRQNWDLVIFFVGVPKWEFSWKKWSFPILSRIIPVMFWDVKGIKKHGFGLNLASGNH